MVNQSTQLKHAPQNTSEPGKRESMEPTDGLNPVQALLIGQARHSLRRQDEWSDIVARRTDNLLAKFTALCDLSVLGLSPEQSQRLAEMSVEDLGALLRGVL